jgi:ketosteroid isomerase-like protein
MMRALVVLLLALAPVAAPAAEASRPPPETARAVADLVFRFENALQRRDRAELDKLIAEPFTWVHASDGRVDSRATWLETAARGMALSGQRNQRTEHGAELAVYGDGKDAHTAIRVARIRLRDAAAAREIWLRQTQTFVRGDDGTWRLAAGQGVIMYDGPPLDPALHEKYAGTYVISPGRALVMAWEDGSLLATLPSGARAQVFLASPTEEASRTPAAGFLRFTLAPDGKPATAALVRGNQELWTAARAP